MCVGEAVEQRAPQKTRPCRSTPRAARRRGDARPQRGRPGLVGLSRVWCLRVAQGARHGRATQSSSGVDVTPHGGGLGAWWRAFLCAGAVSSAVAAPQPRRSRGGLAISHARQVSDSGVSIRTRIARACRRLSASYFTDPARACAAARVTSCARERAACSCLSPFAGRQGAHMLGTRPSAQGARRLSLCQADPDHPSRACHGRPGSGLALLSAACGLRARCSRETRAGGWGAGGPCRGVPSPSMSGPDGASSCSGDFCDYKLLS